MGSIKEKVLEKIKKGEIRMRPKVYFSLKKVFSLCLFAFAIFLSFFFLSFIHFHLISSGLWYLPKFGPKGFLVFFKNLPWVLIIFAFVLVFLSTILFWNFSFRWPLFVSLLGIFLVLFFGSFAMEKMAIHPKLLLEAKEGRELPLISPIYLRYGEQKFKEFHRGIIEKVSTSSVFIKKPDGEVLELKFEKWPEQIKEMKEGEGVVIFGEKENGKIKNFKMRKIKDQFLPFERKLFRLHQRMK